MKATRTLGIVLVFVLAFSALHGTARADQWDKRTVITFSEPVQLPGTVLQPGTYVFKLAGSEWDRNIVQVFDQNQMRLITTVLAAPNYRFEPSSDTVLEFSERPANQPQALAAWFYPGDDYGQQFVYPKSESQQVSQVNSTQSPSAGSDRVAAPDASSTAADTASQSAPATSTPQAAPTQQSTPAQADEAPMNASSTPATQAEPTTSTTQSHEQADTDATLPKTASLLPLIGLVGLSLIGIALVLRRAVRA